MQLQVISVAIFLPCDLSHKNMAERIVVMCMAICEVVLKPKNHLDRTAFTNDDIYLILIFIICLHILLIDLDIRQSTKTHELISKQCVIGPAPRCDEASLTPEATSPVSAWLSKATHVPSRRSVKTGAPVAA